MSGGGLRSRRCWCRVSEHSMVVGMERAEKALQRCPCAANVLTAFNDWGLTGRRGIGGGWWGGVVVRIMCWFGVFIKVFE